MADASTLPKTATFSVLAKNEPNAVSSDSFELDLHAANKKMRDKVEKNNVNLVMSENNKN